MLCRNNIKQQKNTLFKT